MSIIAQIVGDVLPEYRRKHGVSLDQAKACLAILRCRTGELGYLEASCGCGYRELFACSCRNRHCPTCQAGAALRWIDSWQARIPEVPTYHCIFTVPASLRLLFQFAARTCYDGLFASAREAINQLCARDRRLRGVKLGMIAMLHTWGSQLQFHPHLHILLCGAGFRPDGTWMQLPADKGWLFSRNVLARVFRGVLLRWFGKLLEEQPQAFGLPEAQVRSLLRRAALHDKWGVFLQRSRKGPSRALAYLGRYAYRVGISPRRLRNYDGQAVEITYRSRKDPADVRSSSMDAQEFLTRFLRHVLPCGFRKIRAYGFLTRGPVPEGAAAPNPPPPNAPAPAVTTPHCPRCSAALAFTVLRGAASALMRCIHSPPVLA